MGSFADYAENKILDHITGKSSFTMPTAYMALSTTTPTDAGGITEPSGGAYARVATAAATWNSASGGSTSNTNIITFPQATAGWGTIIGWALYDAASGGNMLVHGSLTTFITVSGGDTLQFPGSALVITQD